MNIYEKINKVKTLILDTKLKKSGRNTYSGFDYYELADIVPTIINGCNDNKLYTHTSFNNELATLQIINIEKPEEKVEFTSPMRDLQLKGCNDLQALGGIETYSRRYLFLMAFDIVEADSFDATNTLQEVKSVFPKTKELKTPTLEDITKIMMENNYTHFTAQDFYNYYSNLGWKSKDGAQINNIKGLLKAWEDKKTKKE
ncbi:ERF family protein [bacterium]|nr:ERF family protein [bacterium]